MMLRRHALALPFAAVPARAAVSSRWDRARHYIDEQVKLGEFAGIHALLWHKGQVVFTHHAGSQTLVPAAPLRPDSIYRIHSMTKPIASAALMAVYEEGKFLLDEPLAKYLPGMDKVKVLSVENSPTSAPLPLARAITIHHVLTHTSGLNNTAAYVAGRVFSGTLAAMAEKLPTVPLSHQPGEAWRYGMGIDVVGYLVEKLSGQPFDHFLAERFFGPLRMKDTAFFTPKEKLARLVTPYVTNDAGKLEARPIPNPDTPPTFHSGGGGLYSTTSDYLRFTQMLLGGGQLDGQRILSPHTVDYMMRNHVAMNLFPPGGPNGRRGYGFGIGGAVLQDAAEAETLSSDGEYTWGGAAGTYFWIDRRNQVIGLWMVQHPPFTQPPSKRFKVLCYQALG